VKALLGDQSSMRFPWISTFHSVCARILRVNGARMGLKSDYAIYDESDQLSMMKTCFERLNMSTTTIAPEAALKKVGEWKNQGKFPADALQVAASAFDESCAQLYQTYEAALREAQAVDFDDLLLLTYRLFRDNEDLRTQFQTNWKYVLIDEFQDTNDIQYKLVKEILNPDRNICVVGDDDQSIYGWRGAKIENILEFDRMFQGAKVIKLEQNYRSTGNILKAAAAIISKNEQRHEKTLWTQAPEGQRIRLMALNDDRDEAYYVIKECKELIKQGITPDEIAIFYRVNSLSRGFEEECLKQRIQYRIVGGFRFYERKEIKDVLSYLPGNHS
jgi:DNA helicase-2/ATP-dependent DNA helicase PcrA